jgi:hypothetical protein
MMCGQTNRFISGDANSRDCIQSGLLSSICLDVLRARSHGMKNVERWEVDGTRRIQDAGHLASDYAAPFRYSLSTLWPAHL